MINANLLIIMSVYAAGMKKQMLFIGAVSVASSIFGRLLSLSLLLSRELFCG